MISSFFEDTTKIVHSLFMVRFHIYIFSDFRVHYYSLLFIIMLQHVKILSKKSAENLFAGFCFVSAEFIFRYGSV